MVDYAKQTWVDGSDGGTPLSAARLNHMEDGIDGAGASPLVLVASSATENPLVVQGAASQTANLVEFQDSAGSVLSKIVLNGAFRALQDGRHSFGGDFIGGVQVAINANQPSNKALVVRGAASQTGNLAEFQNSSGAVVFGVRNNGHIYVQPSDATHASTPLTVKGINPAVQVLEVRGVASQTGDLAQFQNSGGTSLSRIGADGKFTSPYGRFGTDPGYAGQVKLTAGASASGDIPLVVRGAASQSSNLAEFQNSAGTVLAGFTASGRLILTASSGTGGSVPTTSSNSATSIYVMVDGTAYRVPLFG